MSTIKNYNKSQVSACSYAFKQQLPGSQPFQRGTETVEFKMASKMAAVVYRLQTYSDCEEDKRLCCLFACLNREEAQLFGTFGCRMRGDVV